MAAVSPLTALMVRHTSAREELSASRGSNTKAMKVAAEQIHMACAEAVSVTMEKVAATTLTLEKRSASAAKAVRSLSRECETFSRAIEQLNKNAKELGGGNVQGWRSGILANLESAAKALDRVERELEE
jgi:hypothetical protein